MTGDQNNESNPIPRPDNPFFLNNEEYNTDEDQFILDNIMSECKITDEDALKMFDTYHPILRILENLIVDQTKVVLKLKYAIKRLQFQTSIGKVTTCLPQNPPKFRIEHPTISLIANNELELNWANYVNTQNEALQKHLQSLLDLESTKLQEMENEIRGAAISRLQECDSTLDGEQLSAIATTFYNNGKQRITAMKVHYQQNFEMMKLNPPKNKSSYWKSRKHPKEGRFPMAQGNVKSQKNVKKNQPHKQKGNVSQTTKSQANTPRGLTRNANNPQNNPNKVATGEAGRRKKQKTNSNLSTKLQGKAFHKRC